MRLFKRRQNTRDRNDNSKEESQNNDDDAAIAREASIDLKQNTRCGQDSISMGGSQSNNNGMAFDGEASLDLNQILNLHDLSDKAMKQAIADKEETDEMESSSQISLTIADLLENQDSSDPPAADEEDTFSRNDSIVKIGHTSDVSIMINLATEYSNHRNHSSLQLSSKPWEAVTEQPHQRRRRREQTNSNCNVSGTGTGAGTSPQVRQQKSRKDYGSKKSLSRSCTDINYDHTGSPSFAVTDNCSGKHPIGRRRRMSRSRSSSGSSFSSSPTGTSRPSPGSTRRGRHASLRSKSSRHGVPASSRSLNKEGIVIPRRKDDRIRSHPHRSRANPKPSRAMLRRSTSSPSSLRQINERQKTDLDVVQSSPRKERGKVSDVNTNSATCTKGTDKGSNNRIRRRPVATQESPSKQTNNFGGSFSSFGHSSFQVNDLDFGGSFSSLAHTSFSDLQQLSKETERKSRRKQNRKIKKDLLVNAYPIDFGPMSAVAHASYYSLSKVKEEQQQVNDEDIVFRGDLWRKSLADKKSRKETMTREISKKSNGNRQRISRRQKMHAHLPKMENTDSMKISQSSLATFTDTTDTTAQLSQSFSSLSTTFSSTLQAMKQQAPQQTT